MPTPVVPYRIPDWANPANASVLDSWAQKAIRTLGGLAGVADPVSQVMGLAAAPIDVPAANLAEGLGAKTLKAYHGSPHDFDQFSLGKIGTGEGGQAYGHGLYFAENPAVAKDYARKLSSSVPDRMIVDGNSLSFAQGAEKAFGKDTASAMGNLQGIQNNPDAWEGIAGHLRQAGHQVELPRGKTYEVNLHTSPDELLDWDKPLSQQSPKVQEALKDYKLPDYVRGDQIVDMLKNRAMSAQEPAARQALHQYAPDATFELQRNGIKGIQYLDQGSRGASDAYEATQRLIEKAKASGFTERAATLQSKLDAMEKPTRNFVVFDDKLIEIRKKYGVSLPVAYEIYRRQQAGGKNGDVESSAAP
jgi:hypothetical protein